MLLYLNLKFVLQYALSSPSWNEFAPSSWTEGASAFKHFGARLKMVAPAPAPPAILAYLTLANKLSVSWDAVHYMKPPSATPPCLAPITSSREWDAEWMRAFHLADTSKALGATFSGAFIPGSLEGVWEGLFTVRHLRPDHSYERDTHARSLAVHRVYSIRGPPLRRTPDGSPT